LQTAGEERLAQPVAVGLAPLRYPQSVDPRKMLRNRRHISVMYSIDGIRPVIDRLLARVPIHIECIEKLPDRRIERMFAGFDPTDHLHQRSGFASEQAHDGLEEVVAR
jgi:hypothetical protein